jgi:hypothetical protein
MLGKYAGPTGSGGGADSWHGNTFINMEPRAITTGYFNINIGPRAGASFTTAHENIAIGVEAAIHAQTVEGIIAIGREALAGMRAGVHTIGIGDHAGSDGGDADPSYSIYLGRARTNEAAPQGEIVLANDPAGATYGKGSNTMLLGGANITDSWVAGNVHIKSVQLNEDNIAQPACTAALRGRQWYVRDDVLGDTLQVCIRQAGGSYVWKTVLW